MIEMITIENPIALYVIQGVTGIILFALLCIFLVKLIQYVARVNSCYDDAEIGALKKYMKEEKDIDIDLEKLREENTRKVIQKMRNKNRNLFREALEEELIKYFFMNNKETSKKK